MPPADSKAEVTENYIKAVNLNCRIITSAQLAQQSLYDMCMGFKEMRDSKLYKELGYSDFGDYCEQETGIKRRQVYNYISVCEKLPEDFVQPVAQIGMRKLLILSKLDESDRAEITESTDLENTTVRELEEKISDLKKANDRLMDKVNEEQEEIKKSRQNESKACEKASILETDNEFYKTKVSQLEETIKGKEKDILSLENTIEELESRPVEVAVSESHEIKNMEIAMKKMNSEWEQRYSELEEEGFRIRREDFQKHKEEMDKVIEDYERKLAEGTGTETVTDTKEVFKAYLATAVDAVKRLVDFTKKNPDKLFRERALFLADEIKKNMEV